MINKKLVITTVVSAILTIGIPTVFASTSNDLLRMDVKKSTAQDTVDVTFYTTGNPANSVVTRKSGNSYVVLLPNVSGNQSVVPSLGGVKDLVNDITVKNVDDGIGGYTKVTFSTTRPVRIQTYSKQTAPLTSAQQGYKNLLAQSNNIKPISNTSEKQPAAQNKTAAPTPQKPAAKSAPQTKPAAQQPKAANQSKTETKTVKPQQTTVKSGASQVKPAAAPVKPSAKVQETAPKAPQTQSKQSAPEPKAVNNNKPVNVVADNQPVNTTEESPMPLTDENVNTENNDSNKIAAVPVSNKKSVKQKVKNKIRNTVHESPIILIAGAFCMFGIFLFAGLAGIISKGVEDKRNRLKEYLDEQSSQEPKKASSEFQEIMDDKESNWQEKYRRYTKIKEDKKKHAGKGKMSYVANMSSPKGVIVSDEQLAKNRMQETISKMEHSLSQTPSSEYVTDFPIKYHSEDDAISNKMSKVKLKSFAKSVNLSETGRNLVSFEDLANRKSVLKEGKFVRMNNSSLSMSRRKSASSGLNFANIVRNSDAHSKTDDMIMNKQQEEYVLSSINEYMNLLEHESTSSIPSLQQSEEISRALDDAANQLAASKNLVTNPMASQRKTPFSKKPSANIGSLNIKSNYNIDSNKSIYLVDLDGISSIIGKIGDEIFVLKKFEKIINKPMQVRLDYGNTYIVRVGNFKCLVDVTENKMGTLLEI